MAVSDYCTNSMQWKKVISLFKFSIEFHPTKHHVCQWRLGIGWRSWSSLLFSNARKTARKWPCHFPSMIIGRKLSWVSRGNDAFFAEKKNGQKRYLLFRNKFMAFTKLCIPIITKHPEKPFGQVKNVSKNKRYTIYIRIIILEFLLHLQN